MKKDKKNKEYIVKFYFINKSTFSTVITEEWKDEIEKTYIDEAIKEGKVNYQREYEPKEDTKS